MTYDELQRRFPVGSIINCCGSRRWRVQVPTGRESTTGKRLHHTKSIRGAKKDAQAYADWVTGMVVAGQSVTATVSQTELGILQALQAKADQFRAKLEAAVQAGAKVEPGDLKLD